METWNSGTGVGMIDSCSLPSSCSATVIDFFFAFASLLSYFLSSFLIWSSVLGMLHLSDGADGKAGYGLTGTMIMGFETFRN